ncbi:NAD(P)-dependent oxidoreductase [[Eubacterium] cellulosolvens]
MRSNNVGLIGLGAMGLSMGKNLLKNKFDLTVFDVRDEPIRILEKLGAQAAKSPKQVGNTSNIVLLSLPSSKEVEDVVLGENGLIHSLPKGGIILDASTIDPAAVNKLANKCNQKSITFIDAPVSGGTIGAEKGTLSIMVGGPNDKVDESKHVLQAIGTNIYQVGNTGAGQIFKLINNMLVAINLVGISEGFVLAKKTGIDLKKLYEVLKTSAGNSWALEQKLPKMIQSDFEPGFKVWLQHKDLSLAMNLASQMNVSLPMTSLAYQMYESAKALGFEDLDHSAVAKIIQSLSLKDMNK